MKIPIDKVLFKPELWPREEVDNKCVELYRLNIDKLPPITLNEDFILIDGYHRLLAHKLEGRTEIEYVTIPVPENQILVESARMNREHGKQLSFKEKQRLAVRFREKDITQEEIAKILAVDQATVSRWLQDVEQTKREERDEKIVEMYLQCYTQEEIAAQIGVDRSRISKIVKNLINQVTNEIGTSSARALYAPYSCLALVTLPYPLYPWDLLQP